MFWIGSFSSSYGSSKQDEPLSICETVEWNKNTLRTIMEAELPGVEVLVVANREPYIHNFGNDGVELQTPASGLVSAVEPIMRACRGTWIAHGSGTADRETVDQNDRIAVPPDGPEYTLRRVWITEAEQDGYYYGLANEGLWPLCHIAFTRPTFRLSDWETYRAVNHGSPMPSCGKLAPIAPIVLVQDYHFALLPRMLRERLPNATIIAFWHIPWPNSETFGIFPWKEELIHGLLGSTIIGFHTQFHCNNFLKPSIASSKAGSTGSTKPLPGRPRDIRETLPDFDRVAARRT